MGDAPMKHGQDALATGRATAELPVPQEALWEKFTRRLLPQVPQG